MFSLVKLAPSSSSSSSSSSSMAPQSPSPSSRLVTMSSTTVAANLQHLFYSRKNSYYIALNSLILILIIYTSSTTIHSVTCTPPIDYFVYTSQLAQNVGFVNNNNNTNQTIAQQQQQQNHSILTPLREIFYEDAGASSGIDGNVANQNVNAATATGSSGRQQLMDEWAGKVLSLFKNTSHTHDNDMIDMDTVRYAWHLMEKQASLYTKQRISTLKPFVSELLREAQVSNECQVAVNHWLENLTELRQWAVLMWNSWGQFPPAGLYEGSYTDLGSYRGCMSVKDNEFIGQAQYCSLDFQPLVPTRPRFHSIFKRILDVDPASNRLVNGDFEEIERISSLVSAHGYGSSRFHFNNLNDNEDESAADGSSSSASKLVDSSSGNNSKYSKRTIVSHSENNTTTTDEVAAAISAVAQEQGTAASLLLKSNLTLKAEALIALAQKAQYFYYVKFRLGACFPSKCTQDDVQKLAQSAGQRAILQANGVNCMKKEPYHLNGYQKFAIWVLSLLAFVAFLGTVVDLLGFKDNQYSSSLTSWLLPFSMWTNAKRLFDSDTAGTHADLECVHGLRFFSMIWVIYGHTILYTEYQSFTHFYDVIETQIPSFILLPTLNANFSVDTFFVISGILTTYVTWEYTKGDYRKFNKFAFTISRYIRLTPQLAIVMLCFFLLPLFGDGPLYKQVTEDKADVCYKNWGINLLYLQSYINTGKLCIDPSWWLSIEMSFHLISLVLITVMIQNPTKGMLLNVAVATTLTLIGAAIHYTNGFAIQYLPSIPQRYEVPAEQTKLFFHRPYPHAASYCIGIALGYILANRTIKKLTKLQVYQGWLLCALGLIIPLYGSYYWNLGAPYTQLQATLYYNLCQVLWPISISWIILACSLGHGGYVDSILTAPCFVPLGRITYMTYLSHALIIYYHSASMHVPVEPSMLLFVYLFIANTFLSLLLGSVLTIVYESPLLNLQKKLFAYLTQKFDPTVQNQSLTEIPPITLMNGSPKTRYTYRNTLSNNTLEEDHIQSNNKQ